MAMTSEQAARAGRKGGLKSGAAKRAAAIMQWQEVAKMGLSMRAAAIVLGKSYNAAWLAHRAYGIRFADDRSR